MRLAAGGGVVAGADRSPPWDGRQGPERAERQQPGQLISGCLNLAVQVVQQRQVGGQNLPGDLRIRHRQRIVGHGDKPVSQRLSDLQPAGRAEPDEPIRAQRGQSGGVSELGRDQPADLGPEHVGQRQGQPREAAVELSEQLVLGRGADLDPAGSVRRPGSQLDQHRLQGRDRQPAAGQQQLGHRLEIDRVGLDRALTQHPALLGDMAGVELEQLPAGRPHRRAEQRQVIVPGRLDTDLDGSTGRQQPRDPADHVVNTGRRHRTAQQRLEQPGARGVGHRDRELVLAHVDRDRDRRRRHWGSMSNYGTHLRGAWKERRSNAGLHVEEPDGPFLAPPEVLIWEPPRAISATASGTRSGSRSGP